MKKQNGFSLIEIIIAVGLTSGVALTIAKLNNNQLKVVKNSENNLSLQILYSKIINSINQSKACEAAIGSNPIPTGNSKYLTRSWDSSIPEGNVPTIVNGNLSVILEPNKEYTGAIFQQAEFARTAADEVTFYFNFTKNNNKSKYIGSPDKMFTYVAKASFNSDDTLSSCTGNDVSITNGIIEKVCEESLQGTYNSSSKQCESINISNSSSNDNSIETDGHIKTTKLIGATSINDTTVTRDLDLYSTRRINFKIPGSWISPFEIDMGMTGSPAKPYASLDLDGSAHIDGRLTIDQASSNSVNSEIRINNGGGYFLNFGVRNYLTNQISTWPGNTHAFLNFSNAQHLVVDGGTSSNTGTISPKFDNRMTLGTSTYRWKAVYAASGVITTSDRRKKKEIKQSNLGLDFILNLNPVMYKYNDNEDNEKFSYGFIAQEVEKEMKNNNDIIDYDKKSDLYGVRYSAFISPIVKSIQELNMKNERLEKNIEQLKTQNTILKEVLCSDPKKKYKFCI